MRMDVDDGHISGAGQGPHSIADTGGGADTGVPVLLGVAEEPPIHPRLLAMIVAGRYHGLELDPNEFRGTPGDPSAAALCTWAQNTGMWSRAVRLRWRHLMRFHNTGPVVLLFTDGTAGLLTGVNTEHRVVLIKDPTAPAADAPVPVDELRLSEVWAGEAVLLRARGFVENDAPFSLRWLLGMVMLEKRSLRDIGVASFALSLLTVFPPFLVMTVVDKVLTHRSYSTLELIAVVVAVAIIFETLLGHARRSIVLVVGARIDARINLNVFNRLLRLPLDYFERHPAGETMYKISQIHRVREFIAGRMLTAFLDLMTLCVLLPFVFWLNAELAWIVLACACVIAIIILAFLRPLGVLYGRVVAAETQKQSVLGETVFGVRTVKSLALEPQRKALWDERIADAGKWRLAYGKLGNWPQTLVTPIERFMWMGVILLGVYWALSDTTGVSGGALFAFMMLSQRIAQPLVQLARLTDDYQDVATAISETASVLNRPLEADAASGGLRPRFAGAISFDDVSFTYGGTKTPALDRITFSIPAGTMLGIVGRSGSGKSTIARLLQGINRDYSGYLKIDGTDLRDINLRHLRQSFGVVLQDNFLFRGSIRDNILAGRPGLAFEDAVRAARLAGAEEFIERMPNGYATYVEEGSPNLSGGQKQRLAIARALINDPRILILDEATSALDPESEALVNANLLHIARNRTMIIVSHRLSSLTECDQTLVLEKGQVVDIAPHRVLLERCTVYRQLWAHQNRHLGSQGPRRAALAPTLVQGD
jgi:ATP-binding cassette, subfamily B, bacterial HlyB/CyaB